MNLIRLPFVAGTVVALTVFTGSVAGAPKPPAKKAQAQPAKPKTSSAAKPKASPEKLKDPAPAAAAEEKPAASPDTGVLYFKKFQGSKALVDQLPKGLASERLTAHLTILATAYVNTITGVVASPDGKKLFLVASDGSRHLYDDGRTKDHEQLLNEADIEDMFIDNYPLTNPTDRLALDFDPGRARPEALFKALYGDSPEDVRKNLVNVSFAGKKVLFNKLHGASAALEKVSQELEPVLKAKPELKVWMNNLGGTFNWRKIEGTERLSTHSYGIAIDLNADKAKYWRWEKPSTLASFTRRDFPVEIIQAFEKHGFV
ncbi:MAG TPA: M15 family metallopeptidase, partial [Verrucomicrobiales bacterium]|nr:M15 family metallopeptidase [Verrucomicrobiales bacterium]